jgi:carbamoyl-phosphate synthase large subunit
VKSVRVLILDSSDTILFHILRTLEKSLKYDFTIFRYGSENEFIQKLHNIKLIDKPISEDELLPFLLDICKKNEIDIILPTNLTYLKMMCENLAQFRAINTEPIIPVSDPSLLEIVSHRPTLYEYSKNVLSISVPEYRTLRNQEVIVDAIGSLGYPQKPILFSPSWYSQIRNIRLIDNSKNLQKLFFDEKPDPVYTTLQQFTNDIGDVFPEITAIKYDCITEYSVEVLCRKGQTFATLVYSSNPLSDKMNTYSVLTKDQYFPIIEKLTQRVVEGFGFSYSIGMRIWIDSEGNARLIDVIPHLRDDVILCLHGGVNLPESMIDMALREFDYDYKPKIKWGLKMQQVWLEIIDYQGDVWKTEL